MVEKVRIRRHGDEVRASLPREMVERLGIRDGDELAAVETDRGILLTAVDRVENTMKLLERSGEKFDQAYRKLAE